MIPFKRLVLSVLIMGLVCSVSIGALSAQKWRTNARSRTAAERYLTKDTFGIISVHPKMIVSSPWFQQLPKAWTDGAAKLLYHSTMIEADPKDVKHLLVMLEPFTADELAGWIGNGQKPWHGRTTKEFDDKSIGAPSFVGTVVTFETDEAADKCHARMVKFGKKGTVGQHDVVIGNWGSSPVVVYRGTNQKELMIASESRFQRMMDPGNTNDRMRGLIKHVWRPYQEFALFLPEAIDSSIVDSFSGVVPANQELLQKVVADTGSVRLEFKPNENLYMDWRAKDAQRQAELSRRIKEYCQTSLEYIDTSIPRDYINFDVYFGMGQRIFKHLLSSTKFDESKKEGCFSETPHPRSIQAVVGEIPPLLRISENKKRLAERMRTGGTPHNSRRVRSGKKKMASRGNGNKKRAVSPGYGGNKEVVESDSFNQYMIERGWRLLNDIRDRRTYPVLSLEDTKLSSKDCQMIAASRTIRMLALNNVQVAPADLKVAMANESIDGFFLNGDIYSDQHLKALRAKANLRYLTIQSGENLTDAGVAHLARNRNMEQMFLFSIENVSAKGLNRLLNQPNLEIFLLLSGNIDDASFAKLAKATNLKKLSLSYVKGISDSGVARLAKLESLNELELTPAYGDDQLSTQGILNLVKNRVPDSFEFPKKLLNDELAGELISKHWLYGPSSNPDSRKPVTSAGVSSLGFGRGDNVTDRGFEYFLECKNIEMLTLKDSKLTDVSLKKMQGFNRINWLDISRTNVTAAGISTFHDCPIERFSFEHCEQMSQELFEFLARLKTLKTLDLSGSKFDSQWLGMLQGCESLKELRMWNSGLTDSALIELARLPAIEEMSLQNNRLTLDGLKVLVGHQTLKKVRVGSNDIDEAALKAFNQKHSEIEFLN